MIGETAGGSQMIVGIMQPYFLPYLGYFQLIQHCDVFVIYDNIEYTKRGWINRNRMLFEGQPRTFTIPLERGSDYLDVRDRIVSVEYRADRLMRQFQHAYSKAPHWSEWEELLGDLLRFPSRNLFEFIANSIVELTRVLSLKTEIVTSSSLESGARRTGQERVLAICEAVGATQYVNPIGGQELYDSTAFGERGISLGFLRSHLTPYKQYDLPFVAGLTIIDALCFLSSEDFSVILRTDYQIESS